MTGLLTALGSIALLLLLVGLVKPRWVLPPRWNPNRLKATGVYLGALLVFSALLNTVKPAPDAISAPPVHTGTETRSAATAATTTTPTPASLRAKRDQLVKTVEGWGWVCKAPNTTKSLVALAGQYAEVPSEIVFCAPRQSLSDPNFIRDYVKIEGTPSATYLVIYDWDLTASPPTSEPTTSSRIAEITRLIGGASAEKDARVVIEKQRDLKREQSCKNFTDCPSYDEQVSDGAVAVRIMAKPKTGWNWAFFPAERAAIK